MYGMGSRVVVFSSLYYDCVKLCGLVCLFKGYGVSLGILVHNVFTGNHLGKPRRTGFSRGRCSVPMVMTNLHPGAGRACARSQRERASVHGNLTVMP